MSTEGGGEKKSERNKIAEAEGWDREGKGRIYGIFSHRLRAGQTSIELRFNVFPARCRISGRCIFREKSRVRIKLVIA